MKKYAFKGGLMLMLITLLALIWALPAAAQPAKQDDLVAHGKYITSITGCQLCHTQSALSAKIMALPDPTDMSGLKIATLDELETLFYTPAVAGHEWAGGEPFALGPLGVVFSKNLTSDTATGLGDWTDEEIATAFTTGVSKDGLHLFPIMPYHIFNNMADSDVTAVIAYLRTLPAVSNAVPRKQILPSEQLPQLDRKPGIKAPEPSDTAARGRYLMTSVLLCNDCHTPLDPATGAPDMTKFLGGGQPFEGPWGIVYGGNITPDKEKGIGSWSADDIKRVLQTGIRPDGRRVILMPWRLYANLTSEDLNAVVYFLQNDLKPVSTEVPAFAPAKEAFVVKVATTPQLDTNMIIGIVAAVVVVIAVVAVVMMRQRKAA
jgi:mono/diheme cytochrome c family protein